MTSARAKIWICGLVSFLMATTACSVDAQVPQEVTAAEYFAAKVNGHTALQDFHTEADNRDPLKVTVGQPTAEVCETTAISTACTVTWDGVEVAFTDIAGDLEVATLTLTTPAAFVDYGGTTIRVGDPISRLQQIFPEAYQNRGDNCPAPPGYPPCRHAVIVHDGGINWISLTYNPSTPGAQQSLPSDTAPPDRRTCRRSRTRPGPPHSPRSSASSPSR